MPTPPEPEHPAPSARVRRRAHKRHGPPQLQFVTATDPSQFKDETAKRSVRSQAMIQYRYKAEQQKRRKGAKTPAETNSGVTTAAPPSLRVSSSVSSTSASRPRSSEWSSSSAAAPPILAQSSDNQHIYPSTAATWRGARSVNGFVDPPWFLSDKPPAPAHSSRYQRALSIRPLNAASARVIDYEQTEAHGEAQMRMLIAKLATVTHIGDGVDPFAVLPQFKSPELSSLYLVRTCNRAFVSRATILKWIPAMLQNPHLLLSATTITSTWLDMQAGCSGDSKRTVLVKQETIGWINERLRDPIQQYQDATLMVILHLIAGEMWNSNEETLRIHESGIARLISHRGGMEVIGGSGAVGEVAAASCLHADIICEAVPLSMFHNWVPPDLGDVAYGVPIPESPMLCPREELYTLARDPKCSELTYGLLCDMRDLTDLALLHCMSIDQIPNVEGSTHSGHFLGYSIEFEVRAAEIATRVAALPSAYESDSDVLGDWVYESCRIAAIIYASALISRVPFSMASEPGHSIILTNPAALANTAAYNHLRNRRLTEPLYEVLGKSNMEDVWGDMSGVLYWVTAVGAASARIPALSLTSSKQTSSSESYATWIRRCLIMFATRTMLILIFQHPRAIILAQKKLIRIQEIIASNG